jgi:hypothetical protein
MKGGQVNGELERMWKEAVVAYIWGNFPGATGKKHGKPVRIVGLRAEI